MTAPTVVSTGHAHGKLILLGEHAVVWGAPALVVTIALELRATGRSGSGGGSWLEMLGGRHRAGKRGAEGIPGAYGALLASAGMSGDRTIVVTGELPAGVGLGFSAAAGVAVARALRRNGDPLSPAEVEQSAMAWERVFHGNPSGVDVAAAMGGGVIRFTRAAGPEALSGEAPLVLAVGLSGVASATKDMVARVARLREKDPDGVTATVEQIGELVERAVVALRQADWLGLGRLMDQNQEALARLDLSTPTLAGLCAGARQAGALGAKLTGAGGGGAVVALAGVGAEGQQVGEQVVAAWRQQGRDGFVTEVAPPGIARGEGQP